MNWIQEHLQLIIVIAGSIAYWLNQRKQAQTAEEEAPPNEQSFDDPEAAERARRIREEIQRKIAERSGAPSAPRHEPEPAELPPLLQELLGGRPAYVEPEPEPVPVRENARQLERQRQAEILEQQAALAEQLRQAQEMKALAVKRAAFETQTADHTAEKRAARNTALAHDLRDPAALRRAFVMREVLGPPVALRS